MVKLNKIYTRTGDDGTTGLGTGERRLKSDLRIDAYGTVDEANACIGMARAPHRAGHPAIDAMLGRIQNDLFDLGADLATPDDGKPLGYEPLRIIAVADRPRRKATSTSSTRICSRCSSFVLPGGTPAAAALASRPHGRAAGRAHHGGAGARPGEHVNREALKYINRVSDFLFVAARAVNDNGNADVLWVPGKNR